MVYNNIPNDFNDNPISYLPSRGLEEVDWPGFIAQTGLEPSCFCKIQHRSTCHMFPRMVCRDKL